MSFTQRMGAATRFEREVLERINATHGWQAVHFGQGTWSAETRDILKRTRSSVRWAPDILAVHDNGTDLWLDPKSRPNPGDYLIETASVRALRWWAIGNVNTYIVGHDWNVFTPAAALVNSEPGTFCGYGSGTPFIIVRRESLTNIRTLDELLASEGAG